MKFIRKYYQELSLIFFILLSRLPLAARYLSNWDAANFALGLKKFDITQHQPQAPGYIIYIYLAKIVNLILPQANDALIVLSIGASILTVIIFLYFCRLIFKDKFLSYCLCLILVFNPVFWYYGLIASTYIFDALFSIIFAYLAVLILGTKESKYLYWLTASLAVAGGFRETLLALFFLVYLYCFIFLMVNKKLSLKQAILNIFLGVIIVMAWFIPLVYLTGGLAKYFQATNYQWSEAAKNTSIFEQLSWVNFWKNLKVILRTTFGVLNLAIFLPIILGFYWSKLKQFNFKKHIWENKLFSLFLLWLLPSYLVYSFIHFGQVGYLMTVSLALLVSFMAPLYLLRNKKRMLVAMSLILVLAGLSTFLFLNSDLVKQNHYLEPIANRLIYFWGSQHNYQSIHQEDVLIKSYLREIAKFDPQKTIIMTEKSISFQESAQSAKVLNKREYFRQLQYYLPQYNVYEITGSQNMIFKVTNFYPYKMSLGNTINIGENFDTILIVADDIDYQVKANQSLKEVELANGQFLYVLDISKLEQIEYSGYLIKKYKT